MCFLGRTEQNSTKAALLLLHVIEKEYIQLCSLVWLRLISHIIVTLVPTHCQLSVRLIHSTTPLIVVQFMLSNSWCILEILIRLSLPVLHPYHSKKYHIFLPVPYSNGYFSVILLVFTAISISKTYVHYTNYKKMNCIYCLCLASCMKSDDSKQ